MSGVLASASPLPAAPQQTTTGDSPVSIERIREGLDKPAKGSLALDTPLPLPVPRFRTGVEQRRYMLTFEEQLRKDLELTPMQRQSADWASRCCGLDLSLLFDPIDRAMQRRKERKVRERIAGELEDLKAAREQAAEKAARDR
jgi:hypothetical protein